MEVKKDTECPVDTPGLPDCTNEVGLGAFCEMDTGVCGAYFNTAACGGMEVFHHVECVNPPPKEEPIECSACDNGYECGICLMALETEAECPRRGSNLPGCTADAVLGGFCEADASECGTKLNTPTCGIDEVYRRVDCVRPSGTRALRGKME